MFTAALLFVASTLAANVPSRPMDGTFLVDGVGVVTSGDARRIEAAASDALSSYSSPIVVVTIHRAADYGAASVDALAPEWFDAWQIGTTRQNGANRGILLLVAVDDHTARIELGQEWGHDWDDTTTGIMQSDIVPNFPGRQTTATATTRAARADKTAWAAMSTWAGAASTVVASTAARRAAGVHPAVGRGTADAGNFLDHAGSATVSAPDGPRRMGPDTRRAQGVTSYPKTSTDLRGLPDDSSRRSQAHPAPSSDPRRRDSPD